jgi:hypothetical protein
MTVPKILPVPLWPVLDEVVKTVNFVKSRPLNLRLYSALCQEMGSDHISLLLHTEIIWLSCGKSLLRVFELCAELRTFLISHNYEYATLFSDESWVAKLAYQSDIFSHLNELNRKMQGKDETTFSTMNKIEGFKREIKALVGTPRKRFDQNVSKIVLIGRKCYIHTINCRTFKYPSQEVW